MEHVDDADHEERVRQGLARAIRALPGVQRMEPTLAQAVARLSLDGAPQNTEPEVAGGDLTPSQEGDDYGVRMTRRDQAVDVTVEISVEGPASALDTAVAVREVVHRHLLQASLTAAEVMVRVLAIDPEGNDDEGRSPTDEHRAADADAGSD